MPLAPPVRKIHPFLAKNSAIWPILSKSSLVKPSREPKIEIILFLN